ncbi:Magnesium-chelatase subunit [Wickerhamomyces ciferrii]|uniref:Magnesium-chelatase subunit n=1 Tax=Wickerhamomyces ciferrii (strain ATCC 14091 / BCRC 22168 / CBS 111 / JCM 3599 / NBRC 0793 / NRRL Y-1031 F-60-10) TaxID=1206466 RepID=K0KVP9_WICCF|nr:Magnesium-chelatase subunit [Wickerhamomyces ciferrii]CCH45564.1 Magnesium-chelatase subunit [Wickerhamomyces ciferrii]
MTVKDEILEHKEQLGVQFDDNLYVALMLGAIAKRHILISSSDPRESEVELKTIVGDVWRIRHHTLQIHGDDIHNWDHNKLLEFFVQDSQNFNMDAIYIILGLDKLPKQLQTLILEIMRTREIVFNGEKYHGGELFMVVGVLDDFHGKDKQLFSYLQDEFWFKQPHDPEPKESQISPKQIETNTGMIRNFKQVGETVQGVVVVPEMKRYIYDIIIFIRTHRCVATGLPGRWITEIELLSKALCVLFNRGFVIPSIIKLAARKLLPSKIRMIKPEHESSLQWGSDPELVNELMNRITPQLIVEDVLKKVSPPL